MNTLEALEAKLDAVLDRVSGGGTRWLTTDAAADYSGLSEPSIRRLVSAGKLTGHRPVPGRVLIDRRQLDALILGSTTRPAGGRGRYRREGQESREVAPLGV